VQTEKVNNDIAQETKKQIQVEGAKYNPITRHAWFGGPSALGLVPA